MSTLSSHLLERVTELIEKTQRVQFVIPEDTGRFSLENDLIGKVGEALDATTELLRDALDYYDALSAGAVAAEAPSDDGLEEIGAQIASELAAQEISGLAFVARSQLLDVREQLQRAVASRSIWKMASQADSALRRTIRALLAVESAIREYEALPPKNHQWKNLEDSLEIRRLYSQFRRAILMGGEPGEDDLKVRLRGAGHRIAILRDLKIYPFLRIDDRLQIRQLQKRIAGWLVGEGETGDEAGRRLWEDLLAFARLLGEINHRQELREHDRRVVAELCHALFDGGATPREIPHRERKRLQTLFGRDDELDEWILESQDAKPQQLKVILERLRRQFEQPFKTALNPISPLAT